MKIAIIAPTEIPARRANTVQVMKMAQAYCELGHQVTLLAPANATQTHKHGWVEPAWEELAHHYGLRHRFPIKWLPARNILHRYDFSLQATLHARRLGAQIIFTRLPQAAAIASLIGAPTILEIHDFPQGRVGPFLFRSFFRGPGATRLVAITHALVADLSQKLHVPGDPPFTIVEADGVDLERYQDLPTPEQARRILLSKPSKTQPKQMNLAPLSADQFTAGYTGHLYPGRGTNLLLEMAARLPQIIFLIVGGEPHDVASLQKTASSLGLTNILLTGFIPNAELPRYQSACDVLLMPYQMHVSASSGGDIARYLSPMKLFEYLACQRAIISSDLPVLQEALNSQNAILLPPNDVAAWTHALQKLQANPELRAQLSKQAFEDAQQYTWKARASRILEGLD